MEFKTTLEIVTKDIQDIEKLVGNFKNYSKIPNIELDLALSRLRNVYDLLLLFRNEAGSLTSSLAPAHEENTRAEPPVVPAVPVIPEFEEIKSGTKDPVEETILPIVEKPAQAIAPEIPKVEVKPSADKKIINEKLLGQVVKKDVASKLQGQAIKSIAGSLGINDKFFFIRELFAGDSENFRQTMAELDELRNFNEAYSLLMGRFQWDMDSEPVQMLLNLIRRKYITSGNE